LRIARGVECAGAVRTHRQSTTATAYITLSPLWGIRIDMRSTLLLCTSPLLLGLAAKPLQITRVVAVLMPYRGCPFAQ